MKELVLALKQHYAFLEELLALLKRETVEMASVRIEAMAEINVLKEDVGGRIQAHLPGLQKAIVEVAALENLPQGSTLGDIAKSLVRKGQSEVSKLHREINLTAAEIRSAADMNREIAERFTETVGQSLEFFSRMLKQSNVYGASGGYQKRPTGAIMINMEA